MIRWSHGPRPLAEMASHRFLERRPKWPSATKTSAIGSPPIKCILIASLTVIEEKDKNRYYKFALSRVKKEQMQDPRRTRFSRYSEATYHAITTKS